MENVWGQEFDWERLQEDVVLTEEEKETLCHELLTAEKRMENLIRKNFASSDYYKVWTHRIGRGRIGGKACGLLLARRLIRNKLPQVMPMMAKHHSYFVGTQVFDDFLQANDCGELWKLERTRKKHAGENEQLRQKILDGQFPQDIRIQLEAMLKKYGNTPLIVRSSSLLEDGFGNAFSGKYESIFCGNQGDRKQSLEELENAIKQVYASTTNEAALEYRKRRHLQSAEEKMAILIQRVEGMDFGEFYMPAAAGMGCSYNPYKWMENMNPEAGMLRLVMGLGTRAVERTPGDYPRLLCLDRAQASVHDTVAKRHKFSQRKVDVLDYATNSLKTLRLEQVIPHLSKAQRQLLLSHDTDAEEMLRERGQNRKVYFADCQGLVDNRDFIRMMRDILKMLEQEYQLPVDVEFAVSTCGERMQVNLFQCRPLMSEASQNVKMPMDADDKMLFDVRRTSMRRSKVQRIDYIVWVDPRKYYLYPYAKKPDVARKIGIVNEYLSDAHKNLMLLVPGRMGTSSPELGVPVNYSEISGFCAICEVAYGEVGYHPDLSYGSHMFQDLVEADVYYGALNENSRTRIYRPQMLEQYKDMFLDICPDAQELEGMIKVYDVTAMEVQLMLDMRAGRAVCLFGK